MTQLAPSAIADLAPPIISLAGMRSPDPSARAAVAAAIRAACRDKGFLYIVDHGIAPELQQAVFAETRRFFALEPARKAEVDMANSPNKRGWEPLRGQVLEAGTPADLKEGFYFGNELPADHPDVRAGLFNHEPNQWPANLPGFRETLQIYYAQMEHLCALTMRALALALDLPETYFDTFCDNAISNMKLLHYPPQPANPLPDEKGCGAHTDWGAVTYLMQDDAGGLQVWDERHGWIDAPPVPNAYVVNLGDLIARWTNGRFRSTLHRVINRSGRERYAVPFFFTGRADYQVVCLPNCLSPGESPSFAPTTPLAHLQEMYQRSYQPA
jgi:isopenicillin N synthase-like dioxygenase